MQKWIVEGANPQTGKELKREIEANTRIEAEQIANSKGMIVSAVRPTDPVCENCGQPFGKLETPVLFGEHHVCIECHRKLQGTSEMVGVSSASGEPSVRPLHYALPAVPDYAGLKIGRVVLMIFAVLYYIGGALLLLLAIIAVVAGEKSDPQFAMLGGVYGVVLALSSLMIGGVLHAWSAGCEAMRDIARNSFQK